MEIRLREENEIGGADVPPAMVNWSNLPLEMIERIIIIGRLDWLDRIRLRAVCKAWSVSSPHIPTVDKFPWALSSYFMKVKNLTAYNYDLIYPPLHLPLLPPFRVPYFHINARAYGSSYGWVLFFGHVLSRPVTEPHGLGNFFLYSPFTNEVIKLPDFDHERVFVATFSLDATSPKCVIFGLRIKGKKISIYICSPGDIAWKTYDFVLGTVVSRSRKVQHVAYAHGIFYCVFLGGELGAFNLQLKKWTILISCKWNFDFLHAKLIASDGELRVMGREKIDKGVSYDDHHRKMMTFKNSKKLKLLKFDFSKKLWVREISLNNHVLFIGDGTCFYCPAVGETSQLANHVFSCCRFHPYIRCYGKESDCLQYKNWAWRTARSPNNIWIESPSRAIWSANDLMTAP